MRKIHLILPVLLMALIGTQVIAEVVTSRKTTQTQTNTQNSELGSSLKSCKPYHERLKTEAFGMNLIFDVKIGGWSNDKCIVDFEGKTNGAGNSFSSFYGLSASDSDILSFEPKVHCEFTQQQLLSVGDSILQEDERSSGAKNNMLKNPNDIDMSSFMNPSDSDEAMLDVIFRQGACKITNISSNPLNIDVDSLLDF